jgi:hypothetical protein
MCLAQWHWLSITKLERSVNHWAADWREMAIGATERKERNFEAPAPPHNSKQDLPSGRCNSASCGRVKSVHCADCRWTRPMTISTMSV